MSGAGSVGENSRRVEPQQRRAEQPKPRQVEQKEAKAEPAKQVEKPSNPEKGNSTDVVA